MCWLLTLKLTLRNVRSRAAGDGLVTITEPMMDAFAKSMVTSSKWGSRVTVPYAAVFLIPEVDASDACGCASSVSSSKRSFKFVALCTSRVVTTPLQIVIVRSDTSSDIRQRNLVSYSCSGDLRVYISYTRITTFATVDSTRYAPPTEAAAFASRSWNIRSVFWFSPSLSESVDDEFLVCGKAVRGFSSHSTR